MSEEVYLKACETVAEASAGNRAYFQFYNSERRHQGMNRQIPDRGYTGSVEWPQAA